MLNDFNYNKDVSDQVYQEGKLHRKINLCKKIIANRICSQARVKTYWCNCLDWKPVNLTDKKVINASEEMVKTINIYTEKFRDEYTELKLKNITKAE